MEQQLDSLTMQLESMKAKNTETAGHNSALDKAIAFKDYEVAKLQESNHVSVDFHYRICPGTKQTCVSWSCTNASSDVMLPVDATSLPM